MFKKKSKRQANRLSILEEKFRTLRTNIEFSQFDEQMRVMNVVSTLPNEGKTIVAVNLAKIFADKYKNVLIIDSDLRNPSVHKMFGLSNSSGLSNLISHYHGADMLINSEEMQSVETPNGNKLYVLSAGASVPNPQEMLASKRFRLFLNEARKEFSIIIIDCPPCQAVADSIPVSNNVDGTLFVVSSRDTDKKTVKEGLEELQRNGANVIGCVLNKAEDTGLHNNYYYYGYGKR